MEVKGDRNMAAACVQEDGMFFHSIEKAPIEISGYPFIKENRDFNRIPNRILPLLTEPLRWVAAQPSGGLIRFRTNSKRITIRAHMTRCETSGGISTTLLSGFDIYLGSGKEQMQRGILTPNTPQENFKGTLSGLSGNMQDINIYTPLQNPFDHIDIGLDEGSLLLEPSPYQHSKPILFYGSSITCGFSASRPGLTYPARICRRLGYPLINFGFGGNAKGEIAIAEAIAELDLTAFVYDYDHNTPNLEHLSATHEPFFRCIRDRHPDLPILMLSSPVVARDLKLFGARRDVIYQTYKNALISGDQHVAFVDGADFFPMEEWQEYANDNLHPNDCGFKLMAELVGQTLESLLV